MSKVVETSLGLVAFIESKEYFNGDLMNGSMGAVSKATGAKIVLLLGDSLTYDDLTPEKAEELVQMAVGAATAAREKADA